MQQLGNDLVVTNTNKENDKQEEWIPAHKFGRYKGKSFLIGSSSNIICGNVFDALGNLVDPQRETDTGQ